MTSPTLSLALKFLEEEPQAAARRLELEAPAHIAALLNKAPRHNAARVLCQMLPAFAAPVMSAMSQEQAGHLMQELNQAEIAAILRHVPDSSTLLSLLPVRKQRGCELLMAYPEYTVGAWTETDLLVLDGQMEVQEALLRLKKKAFSETHDIFVVNRDRQVVGCLSVYELIRRPGNSQVQTLMQKGVATLSGYTELEAALKMPLWRDDDAVAVVNLMQEFIGVIHHHQLLRALHRTERAEENLSATADIIGTYSSTIQAMLDLLSPALAPRRQRN
ncbi:magnesium transporter [Aliiglaciecola sp. CAU 1673]|uniref:magnesium transporter MgtE N-terminal domain-containing protein n=1 Tax=Aliiglaciecola sp. CAU 1673 TaxID=3032595 RepID=UPI0023DCA6E5|nr:CBS domain-containing protein [Aliiglaciecola sp. CAU 1673]MDF2177250.1 magnesium transporter [Aliiglaciecola sp. CAU 1673]